MKKFLLISLFMIVAIASCKKENTVIQYVEQPAIKYEKVEIITRKILSSYPDFVVNYKVKRIDLGVEASATITNQSYYAIGDTILWHF